MHSLQRALTGAGTEDESFFDMGADLKWQPSARALEAAGQDNDDDDDDEDQYED